MKTLNKNLIVIAISLFSILNACKKKETKTEDPVTPTPTGPTYSSFSSTIAVVDYTAPTNASTTSYTYNLSPTTTAIAYIIADNVRIDSLPLMITRVADIVPSTVTSSTATPCDADIWKNYSLNSKEFKLKTGSNNSLYIYEDGVLVSSAPIAVKTAYTQYDFNGEYNISSPKTSGYPCADGKRFRVIQ